MTSEYGIDFKSSATPSMAPTPRGYTSIFWDDETLLVLFACISVLLFLVGVFIYWLQVHYHYSVLNVRRRVGDVTALLLDYTVVSLSLFLFLCYITIYGDHEGSGRELLGGLNPFDVLLASRVISVALCLFIIAQLFSGETAESVAREQMSHMDATIIGKMPLHSLIYRASLGYQRSVTVTATAGANTLGESCVFRAVSQHMCCF